MGKYSYMNLNQKMIKIRKKIPSLIRKRYSEEVNYDFVKLDDINQFLTPALNRYGVDFDILCESPTQTDASGNLVFLTADGNLWRYEADLEVCWTNADRPEEKITAVLHLIGTNDVADKAKGTAMTYGLKYYLLNKFNIPQNGDEDPDMRGANPTEEPPKEKAASGKKEEKKKKDAAGAREKAGDGYMPQGSLAEGLGDMPEPAGGRPSIDKALRSGNAVSTEKAVGITDKGKQNPNIQQMKGKKDEEAASKEDPDKGIAGVKKTHPQEAERVKQPVHSGLDGQEEEKLPAEKRKDGAPKKAEGETPVSTEKSEKEAFDYPEDDFDFSEEDMSDAESAAEEDAGDGFRSVKDEDEIPFSEEEEETQADSAESEADKVEKAKAVVCNFGFYKGQTLGEMLETPKGWESLKWIATRYKGGNTQMKEAAAILVEAGAYLPNAA